jgi:hypothetical protein
MADTNNSRLVTGIRLEQGTPQMSSTFCLLLAVLLLGLLVSCTFADVTSTHENTVYVRDFGAVPDDGVQDTQAIVNAIAHIKATGKHCLVFEAGRYDLDESGFKLIDIDDLTLQGAVDAQGKPATRLVRNNDFLANNSSIPYMLETRNCNRLTLRNLLLDNDPQYATAGEVVSVTGDTVTVRVFESLPRVDGGAYCMNAWDMTTRRLKHQPSVTFGKDVKNNLQELSWHTIGSDADRLMQMTSSSVASQLSVGDGVSWHAGFNGYQMLMSDCDDLVLSNIWTVNAVGFAMCALRCNNITADNVVVRADGEQLAVGPRDGWKLYACTGKVVISNMFIEGVRWDGQNVHGSFLRVEEKLAPNRLVCFKKWSTLQPIAIDSVISFWNGKFSVDRTVTASEAVTVGNTVRFDLTFSEDVPDFTTQGTMATVWAWDIGHYELKNCTFQKIAGSASILRNSHALIEDCTFDNIMYPAFFIGASISEGEGMFPRDVTARHSTFIDCGWEARQGIKGMVAGNTLGNNLPMMGRIRIEDCIFRDAALGINLFGTQNVELINNQFQNVETPYQIDPVSVVHSQVTP